MYTIKGEDNSNCKEEILASQFSASGTHVYCLSSTGVTYVFETDTGKLTSMLHLDKPSESAMNDQVVGMLYSKSQQGLERLLVYRKDQLIKLTE